MHGIAGGEIGRLIARVKLRLHCFDHHDGIVDHRTDGQHKGEKGQDVDTESGHHQAGERTDKRDDDGNRRNERTLEVLQEEVHHKHHKQDGDEQRLYYLVDGGEEEVVGTVHLDKLTALGQSLRHLVEFGRDILVHLGSVGTGHLEGHEGHTGLLVYLTMVTVGETAQFYLGHILQSEHRTVVVAADDHIFEFIYTLQTTVILQGILEGVLRILAKRTGRCFNVLLAEYLGHV